MNVRFAFIFSVLLLLVSCKESKLGDPMEKQNQKLTRHCVGRSVISVPERFSISHIATGQFRTEAMEDKGPTIELVIRRDHVARNKFAAEVAAVRSELQQRTSGDIDVVRLEKALDEQSTLFRVQQVDDAYKSEIVFLRDGNLIRASLESFQDEYLVAERHLINFANSIKVADELGKPSQTQGFCLGPIVITAQLRKEAVSVAFSDKRGLIVELDLDTYAKDAKVPLLARASGPNSLLTKFDLQTKILRSGERVVAGMKAQEWLGRIETGEKEGTYSFAIETMRPIPQKNAPKLHLSLATADQSPDGRPAGEDVSDDEAMQLWDTIVGSIQPAGG
jgi:hypothetical protein